MKKYTILLFLLIATSCFATTEYPQGDIVPETNSAQSLGSTSKRWLKIWSDEITCTGAVGAGTITGTSFVVGAYSLSTEFEYLDGIGAYVYRVGGTDVAVADGGTNLSVYAVGDLIYASGTTTLARLADVTAGSYLRSGGTNTAPLWSTLKLPNLATQYAIVLTTAANTWGEDAGIAYNTASDILSVTGQVLSTSTTAPQLKPSYSGAIYSTFQVGSDGTMTATNTGGSTGNFNFIPTGTGDPVISSGTGILGQGGKGNTNNERFYWDYESVPNKVGVSSTTGVTDLVFTAIGLTAPNFTNTALTSGRVTFASTGGLLADASTLLWDGTYLTANSIKDSALTSGRVVIAGASGLLADDSDLTFSGDTLTVTHIAKSTYKADGVHYSFANTYISGVGTAGTDNTAQTLKTITIPANTLTQVGDRIRVRAYWIGDTGSPITGSIKLGPAASEVLIGHTTDGGGATFQINETYLHYIDNTHSNIIETENGALGAVSAVNVAGFTWASSQDLIFTQDQIANNHCILYALIVDVFPKGA